MKVLHIQSIVSKNGNGPYNLHKEVLKKGIDSKILTLIKELDDPNIIEYLSYTKHIKNKKLKKLILLYPVILENFLLKLFYPKKKKSPFSTGVIGYDVSNHPLVKEADIIHLHWTNICFISNKCMEKLILKKKIVWTFRDSWNFTGGCNVKYMCNKYEFECKTCKVLKSKNCLISKLILKRRKEIFRGKEKNCIIMSPSKQHKKYILKNNVFKKYKIEVIPSNINLNVFKPINRIKAREILNLDKEKTYILFGACYPSNPYKGWKELKESLEILKKETKELNLEILTFGKGKELDNIGFPIRNFGQINDEEKLSILYAAANVFIAPSLEESFGKVYLESIACGTPALGFEKTGAEDTIDHKINGYLAKYKDCGDVSKGIKYILKNINESVILNNEELKTENIINKVIKNYKELFNKEWNDVKKVTK